MLIELDSTGAGERIEVKEDICIRDSTGRVAFTLGMRGDNLLVGTHKRIMMLVPNSGNSVTVIGHKEPFNNGE